MIDALLDLDRKLFLSINGAHTAWLNPIMEAISGQIMWVPYIALIIWYVKQKYSRYLFGCFLLLFGLVVAASDVTSSYILKNIFQRLRPCRLDELKPLINMFGQRCGGKFGFVSSHAANAYALVSFTHLALELKGKWTLVLWILPIIVGYSRIYLGVHYPGDIIGGWIVGVCWGLGLGFVFKHLRRETI